MAKAKQVQADDKQEPAQEAAPVALPDGVIAWARPGGGEIRTNDLPETVAHCLAQGWKRV